MCGIAGLLGSADRELLARLDAGIAHRGPDGEGIWRDEQARVGFAHRRLSIIDLSDAAAQPLVSRDGRYVTVFNGEIFNYRALGRLLAAKGYDFNAASDTAVLAPLYDLKGPDMLHELDGMFAFSIWDRHRGRLFLARDHTGVKPLYYSVVQQRLAFASELKAICRVLPFMTLDMEGLKEYLTFLWTPGERTLVQEIRKLRPGHCLTAELRGSGRPHVEIARWYQPPQAVLVDDRPYYDRTKTPEMLLDLLDEVVGSHCTSDVPIGAFLSGGVDSSAVVASMVATGNRPARVYCTDTPRRGASSEGFDQDYPHAQTVAQHLNVPLTRIVLDEEAILDDLPGLPLLLDEPTADAAPLLVKTIAEQARADGIKVLLSGTGGDDIFSGYRRHIAARLRERLGAWPGIAHIGNAATKLLPSGTARRQLAKFSGFARHADTNSFLLSAFGQSSLPGALRLLIGDAATEAAFSNALTSGLEETRGQSVLNRMLYLELCGFLPDHNLNYTDKACMIAGVEARVPLVDRRLIEFMADVDPRQKLKGLEPKWFFKQAIGSRVPAQIIDRRKVGFGSPIRRLCTTGRGRQLIEDALFSNAMVRENFDRERLERFWTETRTGRSDGVYLALTVAMTGWLWDALKSGQSAELV